MIEFGTLEAVAGILVAVAALIGAVSISVRVSSNRATLATQTAQRATDALIAELRRDIAEKAEEAQRALNAARKADGRISALETAGTMKDEKITALEQQAVTICTQLDNVQTRLEKAEREGEKKDQIIANLEQQNSDLFEANKALSVQVASYERAFSLMQKPESSEETNTPPTNAGQGEQPTEDNQKPQEA